MTPDYTRNSLNDKVAHFTEASFLMEKEIVGPLVLRRLFSSISV
jgi:hypothetical protein